MGLPAVVLAVAMVPAVTAPTVALAATASHRQLRAGADARPGRGLTLAQAPAGLQAAVRRTLGLPAAAAAGAFQQAKLTAADGALGDQFGYSVVISGSTAVVGAPEKNSGAGAVYVFTGSGGIWSQRAELTAAGGSANANFGWSVALSGSTAVVGAPVEGAAYVFTGSGGTWSQRAKLTAAGGASGFLFGFSVALSGSTVVVGAYGQNSYTGAAYVFTGSGSTWSQRAELTASDGAPGGTFGISVAVSGSTVVVGAYGKNSYTGAAYVFTGSSGTWSQQAELTAASGAAGDGFGFAVAVSGSTVVVGSYGKNSSTGAAYVFTGSGGTWSQRAELTAADGVPGDKFGVSVAISGSTAVVGAPGKNSDTGAAYEFAGSGGTWSQQAKLTAVGGAARDYFGGSVALSGFSAVVGALGTNSSTGAGYVFALPTQQAKLTGTDGAANNYFGLSVAVSRSTAVVGAYGKNSYAGAAYVFTLARGIWSQRAELTAVGGAANSYFGWSVALSGTTAVIGAPGVNSSTGAAYVFTGSGGTWSQRAKLTAAGGARDDRFGDAVALSGTVAVIGAPDSNANTGAAYVFTGSGGTWTQQAKLAAGDAAGGDYFGSSVAVSGTTAVVGAPVKNTGAGAAYVYAGSGGGWPQQAELTASDPATAAYFGWSVALSGSTAVVGAPGNNNSTGTAYVFTGSGGTWPQQAELAAVGGAPGDKFGISVAIAGSTAVVGAPPNNAGTGVAYVFTGSSGSWLQQAGLAAADGAAGDQFGWSVALSGSTLVVGAPWKNSVTGAAYIFAGV